MPAVPPPLDPAADQEPAGTVTASRSSSWYDPDASAWEPQPPALFEALRASAPRASIAVGPGRLTPSRRPARSTATRRA